MLDLERLARLHAALTAGASWDDLLRRERITRAQWAAAERAWIDALSAEAAAGRFELSDRYLRALAPAPAPQPAPEPRPAPAPIVHAPPSPTITSLPAIPAAMMRFTDVQATQDSSAAPPSAPALPFDPAAAPALPPPSEAPKQATPAWMPKGLQGVTDLDGTRALSDLAPSPALPFASNDAPAPAPKQEAPPAWMPKGLQSVTDLDGTRALSSDVTTGPALPFASNDAPKQEAPAWMPKGMQGLTDVDATQMAGADAGKGPALPFAPGSAAPASTPSPPSAPRSEQPAAWLPKGMQGFADVDGTQAVSTAPAGPAIPFAAPPAPEPPPRLSLEQYARLCVELAGYPAHRAEVLRRYDIDEEQGRKTEAHWSARMQADPAVRKAWEAHCAAHQAWLHRVQSTRR